MPSSPSSPVATTMVALPWKISASALTMSQRMVVVMSLSLRSFDGIGDSGFEIRKSKSSPDRDNPLYRIPNPKSRLLRRLLLAHLLGLLKGLVDAADHVERLLRQAVALTVADHLETADRFLERDVLARRAGEHFGDMERLREEALDLARAADGGLVFFAELVHAENRDDVLEFLVTLQRTLHAARGLIVLHADHVRIELAAGRSKRINRWINTERRDIT